MAYRLDVLMEELLSLKDLLAGGADVAIILFAFFLWKIDRRLLIVEQQIITIFKRPTDENET